MKFASLLAASLVLASAASSLAGGYNDFPGSVDTTSSSEFTSASRHFSALTVTPVPEPNSAVFIGLGLVGLVALSRFRSRLRVAS